MPFLKLHGLNFYFEQRGSGDPPLVFVHGFSCSHEDWQKQVDFFRTGHQVITSDLRGHGFSDPDHEHSNIENCASDIIAIINALGLRNVVLIGHSMGCRVVIQAYVDTPEKVKGIVLIEGSRGLPPGDRSEAEILTIERIRSTGYHKLLEKFFEDMFFEGCDPKLKEHIIQRSLSLPEETGVPLFASTLGWDAGELNDALLNIEAPLLVLQSTSMTPERVRMHLEPGETSPWFEQIKKSVPHARIEIVSGAGHFPMIERPDEINRIVAGFVSEIQS